MSFDLYFCRRESKPLPFGDVVAWAKMKPWFRSETSGQLVYENEDTGVYFTIDVEEELDPEGKGIPDGFLDTGLIFNLNFLRPRYFAWEAMPVIQALQQEFSALAADPQGDMVPRFMEAPELVKSWEMSNEVSLKGFGESDGSKAPVISLHEAERIWKYNSARAALQKKADRVEAFVPRIMPVRRAQEPGKVVTVFAWTEGISTVVPTTDWIAFVRPESRGLFRKKETKLYFAKAASLIGRVRSLLETFEGGALLLPDRHVVQVKKVFEGIRFDAEPKDFENLQYAAFVDV